MDWNRLSRLAVGLLLLCGIAPAQFGDYEWARGLTREFGFDDMAEQVFNDLVSGAGRTAVEKQQGRLGLAEMKQVQARSVSDLETKLALFDEARKLMQSAVQAWPEKNTLEYYSAIFSLAELLQERGEVAMNAIKANQVDASKVEEITKAAEADYGRAEMELKKVRDAMGDPDPAEARQKWRVKNRAWYLMCLLKYNKALTGKPNSAKRTISLNEAAMMLEEFILENETDDDEAMVGALYGYIQLGRVRAALQEPEEAIGNFSSVLDQIIWENPQDPNYRLGPALQGLAELAYFRLLEFLNEEKRYSDTLRYGGEMEARFKKMNLAFKKLGRAARVELAEARLAQGDMSGALSTATEVVDAAGGDASGVLANRLVAEIIAATPDKTQFSPEVIRSAAKGAYSQGGEKRHQAIRYFQILLQVLPQISDENQRKYYEADAWYYMGRAYYFMGRQLEASFCFGEGIKRCKDVSRDDLNENLAKYWRSTLRTLAAETRSPHIDQLRRACDDWMIANPIGTVSKGDLLYNKARQFESEAKALRRAKNIAGAIAKYDEAARTYQEAVAAGGPKKEQAMIKGARTGLTVAQLQINAGQEAAARTRLDRARKAFEEYLKYSDDPANKLTDPKYITSREAARAEARYSISLACRLLMGKKPDPATEKRLWTEALPYLEGFEDKYRAQTGLCVSVIADRIKAKLALGRIAEAEADYKILRDIDPKDPKTAFAAFSVGKVLRPDAEKAWEAVVGKAHPFDPDEWNKVTGKPGFEEARERIRTAYRYYREWLLGGSGQTKFSYWELVTYLWGKTGDWEDIYDIHRKALQRFEETAGADPKKILLWKNKLLHATVALAKKADAENRGDDAGRLWNEAGQLVEVLTGTGSRFAKDPRTVRLAAEVTGGYITSVAGKVKYYQCLGQYDKALEAWKMIEKAYKAEGETGTDGWWEAQFYIYHAAYQKDRATNQDLKALRRKLDALFAINPQGNATWNRYFDWLKAQLF